jgi:hypothetical protein
MRVHVASRLLLLLALTCCQGECDDPTSTDEPHNQPTGSLYVTVSGLPVGVAADVTITGPGSYRSNQTSHVTLYSGNTPGTYTIEADAVSSGTVLYSPDPVSQAATVVADQTTTATVTYTVTEHPPVVFFDDFSVGDQWEETVLNSIGGATSTFETRAEGYRRMTHVFTEPGGIAVRHLYTGGSYDPQTQGAIDYINYSEWRIEIDPPFSGAAVGSRFLVVQNGVTFTAAIGNSEFTNLTWEKGEALQLRPSDFTPAGLDFSDQGAEIRFGFLRSNSTNGSIVVTHGIDDWRVEVVRVQG